MNPRINVLFVCSRNQWRSPTAENIWRHSDQLNVRSRGLSPNAVRVITENDVTWANLILAMENRHRAMLIERFADVVDRERVHVLDIADEYRLMDPELVELLRERVGVVE